MDVLGLDSVVKITSDETVKEKGKKGVRNVSADVTVYINFLDPVGALKDKISATQKSAMIAEAQRVWSQKISNINIGGVVNNININLKIEEISVADATSRGVPLNKIAYFKNSFKTPQPSFVSGSDNLMVLIDNGKFDDINQTFYHELGHFLGLDDIYNDLDFSLLSDRIKMYKGKKNRTSAETAWMNEAMAEYDALYEKNKHYIMMSAFEKGRNFYYPKGSEFYNLLFSKTTTNISDLTSIYGQYNLIQNELGELGKIKDFLNGSNSFGKSNMADHYFKDWMGLMLNSNNLTLEAIEKRRGVLSTINNELVQKINLDKLNRGKK